MGRGNEAEALESDGAGAMHWALSAGGMGGQGGESDGPGGKFKSSAALALIALALTSATSDPAEVGAEIGLGALLGCDG